MGCTLLSLCQQAPATGYYLSNGLYWDITISSLRSAQSLIVFCGVRRTYMTLIGQGKGRTRLQQVLDWCGGPDWDGPLIFDEAGPPAVLP